MPRITFLPQNVSVDVPAGTSVFRAAAEAELPIASQCGGKCACGMCRVRLIAGEQLVSAIEWEEEQHMGNCFFLTRERLSCQLRVYGDIRVELLEHEAKQHKMRRYVPRSVVQKREQLEREDDASRAHAAERAQDKPPSRDGAPKKRGRRGGRGRPRGPSSSK